jgi:hypothetical protein
LPTLNQRLDALDRRIAEQEAVLARLHELLRLPPRASMFAESLGEPTVSRLAAAPAVSQVAWHGARYVFGVFARLAVSAALFALALAALAEMLNLLGR